MRPFPVLTVLAVLAAAAVATPATAQVPEVPENPEVPDVEAWAETQAESIQAKVDGKVPDNVTVTGPRIGNVVFMLDSEYHACLGYAGGGNTLLGQTGGYFVYVGFHEGRPYAGATKTTTCPGSSIL